MNEISTLAFDRVSPATTPVPLELPLMEGQIVARWCICRQRDFECAETCGWKGYPDDLTVSEADA